jgi:hypothetical protein
LVTAACGSPTATEMCDGLDNDGDGVTDEDAFDALDLYRDEDEDGVGAGPAVRRCPAAGWSWSPGDCDDLDPSRFPGAPERCDGQDQDCDGLPSSLEIDGDGDGIWPCQRDCNDNDATTYPGATERCDGIDQNCDGDITDEFDGDGDGWTACGGDCAPYDRSIYPGAPEGCDGVDSDCDGEIDTFYAVPRRYATPQQALDAAPAGSLICIDEGIYPAFTGQRPVQISGRGPDRTVIDIDGPPVTVRNSVLGNLRFRTRGDVDGPVLNLTSSHLSRVILDLSDCTPDRTCSANPIVGTRGGGWDEVEVIGGVFRDTTRLMTDEPSFVWTSGAVHGFEADFAACSFTSSFWINLRNAYDVDLYDIRVQPCEDGRKPSEVEIGGSLLGDMRNVRLDGDWSTGTISLNGVVRGLHVPTNRAYSVVGRSHAVLEDVTVAPDVKLLGSVTQVTLRRVRLAAGSHVVGDRHSVYNLTLEDVTTEDVAFDDAARLENVTIRGGSFAGLVDATSAQMVALDVRGATFTGPLFAGGFSLRRATLAGNTFSAPVFDTSAAFRADHLTFAANHFDVSPVSAPSGTLSHVVFADNTGDGAIKDAISAQYVHRHEDATAAWSPLSATALSAGDPLFVDVSALDPVDWDLRPGPGSPLIDVGPAGCIDRNSSPCDIGGTGGL